MKQEVAMSAVELPGGGQVVGARRRVWLDVAYAENAAAKAAGARWDGGARRWYAPAGLTTVLARWAVRPPIPELLPGEDRTFGGGLFIDPVPTSCWFTNARSCISGGDWERVRRMVTGRAKHRCEVCAAAADRDVGRWLEVHERWEYIAGPGQPVGTQVLRRLICLCTPCHTATHFGLAQLRGRANEAFAHLCKVTGMSADEAAAHLDGAGATWMARNRRTWNLDLRILTVAGIALATSPEAAHRADIADTETLRARRPG